MLTSAKKIAGDNKTSVLGRTPIRSVSPVMKGIRIQADFSKRIIDRYSGTLNYQFDPAALVLLMQLQEQEQMHAQKKKTYHLTWNLISYLIEAENGKETSTSRKEVEQEVRRQLKSMEKEPGEEYERLREYFHVYLAGQKPDREQLLQSAESRRFVENQEQKEEEAKKAGIAPLSMSASFFRNMNHLFRENRLPDYKEIFQKANQTGLEKYYLSVYMQEFAKEPDEVKREQMAGDLLREFQPSMVLEYLETEGNAKAGLFMKAVKRLNGVHEEDTVQTKIGDAGMDGRGQTSSDMKQVSEVVREMVPELIHELSADFPEVTNRTEIKEKVEKLLEQEVWEQTENKLRESAWEQIRERVKELPGQDQRVQKALLSVLREQFMQEQEPDRENQGFYKEPGNMRNPFYEGIQLILKEAAGQNGERWSEGRKEPERREDPSEEYKKNWKRMEQILEETGKRQEQEEKVLEERILKKLYEKSDQDPEVRENRKGEGEASLKENGKRSGEELEQKFFIRIQKKIGAQIDQKLEENGIWQDLVSGKEPFTYFFAEPMGNVVWEKTEQLLQNTMESEEFSKLWGDLEAHREEILQTIFQEQLLETSKEEAAEAGALENKEAPGKEKGSGQTYVSSGWAERETFQKETAAGQTERMDLDVFLLKEDQQMVERYQKVSASVREILSHADEISKNTLVERVEEFKENFYQQIEELVYRETPEEKTEEELFSKKELRMLLEAHKKQEEQREDSFQQMLREQGRRLSERYAGSMPGITTEDTRKPESVSEPVQENQLAETLTVQKTVKQEVVSFLQNKLELYAYTQLAKAFEQEPQPYLSVELLRQIEKAGNGLNFSGDNIQTSVEKEARRENLQTIFQEQLLETLNEEAAEAGILENKEAPGKEKEPGQTDVSSGWAERETFQKETAAGQTERMDLDIFLLKEDQQMVERYQKVSASVQEILSHADEISKNTLVERVEEFKENFYQQIEELVYRETPEEETEEELFSQKELRMLLEAHKKQEEQREDSFQQMLREQGRRLSERYAGSMPGITTEDTRKPESVSEPVQENQPAETLTVQKTVKQEVVSFLQNKLELYAYTQLAKAFEQEPQPYLSVELLRQIEKAGNGLDFLGDNIQTSVEKEARREEKREISKEQEPKAEEKAEPSVEMTWSGKDEGKKAGFRDSSLLQAGGGENASKPEKNAFLKFLQGESAEPLLKTVTLSERKLLYLSLAHGADGLIVREEVRRQPELWKEILQFKEELVKDGDYSRMIQGDFRFLKQTRRKEELAQAYQALSGEGRNLLEAEAREELLLLSKTVTGKEELAQPAKPPIFFGTQSGQMPDSRELWESMERMRKELSQGKDTVHAAKSELASYFSKAELMHLLRPETKETDAAGEKTGFREGGARDFLEKKDFSGKNNLDLSQNSTGKYPGMDLLRRESMEIKNPVLAHEGRQRSFNEPFRRQMLQALRQVSRRENGRGKNFPGEMYSHLLMQEGRGEIRPMENLPANEGDFLQRRGNYDRIRQIKRERELQKQVVLEEHIQMIFREQQKDAAAKEKPSEEESREVQEAIQRVQELDMNLLEYRELLGEKEEQMEELSRKLLEQGKTIKKLQGKKEERELDLESEAPVEEWMDKLKNELILEQMRNGRL